MINSVLLTETEAADVLSISSHSLRRWRSKETGPRWIKVGGSVRYSKSDLAHYLQRRILVRSLACGPRRPFREFPRRAGAPSNVQRLIEIVGQLPELLPDYEGARLLGISSTVFVEILEEGIGPVMKPQMLDGYYIFNAYSFYEDWRTWLLEIATPGDFARMAELIRCHDQDVGRLAYKHLAELEPRPFVLSVMGLHQLDG